MSTRKRKREFEGRDWNLVLFWNAALENLGTVEDTDWFLKQLRRENEKDMRDLFKTFELMSCELLSYGFQCVQSPAQYDYMRPQYVLDKNGKTDSALTITPSSFDSIASSNPVGWNSLHPRKSLKWLSAPKLISKSNSTCWVEEREWLSTKRLMREWVKPKVDFTCYPRLDAFYDKAIALMANVCYDLTQIVRVLRKRRKWGSILYFLRYGLFFPDECLRKEFLVTRDDGTEKLVSRPVDFVLPEKPMQHIAILS